MLFGLFKLRSLQSYALFLYAFSLSIENVSLISEEFSIAKLAAILYMAMLSFSIPRFLKITKKMIYFFWPIFCMIMVIALSGVVYIGESSLGLIDIALLFNFIVFILIVIHATKDPQVIEHVMLCFALGTTIVAILMFAGVGREIADNGRITFLGENTNLLGLKFGAGLAILLSFFYNNTFKLVMFRYVLLAGAFMLINAIVMTGSRSSLAAVFVIIVLMFFLQKERGFLNKLYMYLIFSALVLGALFMLYQSEVTIYRLMLVFAENKMGGPLGGRLETWQRLFPLAQEYWLFGLGNTGFEYHSIKLFGFYASPHNVLLEVFLCGGVFALLLYSLFLYKVTISAYRIYKIAHDNLPLLVMVPMMFSMLANQALGIKYVWMILAYVIGKYLVMYRLGTNQKL